MTRAREVVMIDGLMAEGRKEFLFLYYFITFIFEIALLIICIFPIQFFFFCLGGFPE